MNFAELGCIQKLEVPDELWDEIVYLAKFFMKNNNSEDKFCVIFSVVNRNIHA